MTDNPLNDNLPTRQNTPIPLNMKIIEYESSENRPIPHDVSLDYYAEENSLFSTEIIIIPFVYYKYKKKYSWEVRKTYKSFRTLLTFIEELLPTRKHYLTLNKKKYFKKNNLQIRRQKEKTLPKNYKEIFYKIFKMNFTKMKQEPKEKLTEFIKMIINSFLYTYYTIKEFFEISNHSFISFNNGLKPKEGEMLKQAEYTTCQMTLIDWCHFIKGICCAGRKRYWFLLKTDMICYLDSSSSKIGKGAFWFDQNTKIKKVKNMVILKNSMNKLKLFFEEQFQRDLWFNEILWRVDKIKNNFKDNIFNSFCLEKQKCKCVWFIDGKDYFSDLKNKLLKAKETVYITDWWLSPELFLQRPVNINDYKNLGYGESLDLSNEKISRLCDILKKIAEKGVKVYILLFKEVSFALNLNSKHSKTFLVNLHPNIKVCRHPKKSFDILWSHHEKLVIIDQQYAYVGGLDLCWGRYDNHSHPIIEPNNEENVYYFPGIDYNNARIKDFENVNMYLKESVQRNTVKMPWHDIHCLIQGPAVLDVGRHFIERWNYSKSGETEEGITNIKTHYTIGKPSHFFKSFLGNAIKKVLERESITDTNDKNNNINNNNNNNNFNNNNNIDNENINKNISIIIENNSKSDNIETINNSDAHSIQNNNEFSFKDEGNNNCNSFIKNTTSKRLLKDNVSNVSNNNKNVSFNINEGSTSNSINNIDFKNNNPLMLVNGMSNLRNKNENNRNFNYNVNTNNTNHLFLNNSNSNKIYTPKPKAKINLWGKVREKKNMIENPKNLEKKHLFFENKNYQKESKENTSNLTTNNTNSNMLEINYNNNNNRLNLIGVDENKNNEEANFDFIRKSFTQHDVNQLRDFQNSISVNQNNGSQEKKKKKTDYYELLKTGFKKQLKSSFKIFKSNNEENKIQNEINLQSYQVEFTQSETKMTCQCLRSLSYWSGGLNKTETSILNAYYHLIEKSEYYIYIENQFFISKSFTDEEYSLNGSSVSNLIINEIALKIRDRILKAHFEKKKFRVFIFIPLLPGFPGNIHESSTLQVILKFTYKTISRNNGLSIVEKLREFLDEKNPDLFRNYISFFSLRNHDILNGIPVTELIYIHSKLMIVDDKYVIMGSANINDRSMIGDRDSEFAVLFKDENERENFNSIMNGENYKASDFAKSLRINLWKEHLGIEKEEDNNFKLLIDPLSDEVWDLINNTAKNNTLIYRDIFNCYPDDKFAYFKDIPRGKDCSQEDLVKLIEKYNLNHNKIKGHIVEFPLEFLSKEILERSFFSAEMLVPIKNFV